MPSVNHIEASDGSVRHFEPVVSNGIHDTHRRPVVIAGCSGGTVDRPRGLASLARLPEIDVITGDWMSEADMTVNGAKRTQLKKELGDAHMLGQAREGYHANFLDKLAPALHDLATNKTKVVCNAGGSNPHGLAEAVKELITSQGLDLTVGWIEGDDVTEAVADLSVAEPESLTNVTSERKFADWPFQPVSAQCYLGAHGIACALNHCDIVICGRVADSSPCIGAAIWWHGWREDQHDYLASALVAGHLSECSSYSCGGCFAGFKKWRGQAVDLGFPIVHIDHAGRVEITLEPGADGEVSVETLSSQLVYEIQGPLYYNSSVVANLEDIHLKQVGPNRVRLSGIRGLPPPPTTKVGITAHGGYRAEYHIYLTGLDIEEKVAMTKAQTIHAIGPENLKRFSLVRFHVAGMPDPEARSQDAATVDLRIFAQSRDPELLSPNNFLRWCKQNILQSCPGLTPSTDSRAGVGKPYFEYWVALMPQSAVQESVHLPDGAVIAIASPAKTRAYPRQQKSYETSSPLPVDTWGPTTRAPLGYVVLGRSGDKSSDANVGFFVRHDDEWDWLRSVFTIPFLRDLLADDDVGKPIDRFEMPGLRAVHFLLRDHLDRGYNAGAGLDCLGKNLVEYLRAKPIDIPVKFLDRGRV